MTGKLCRLRLTPQPRTAVTTLLTVESAFQPSHKSLPAAAIHTQMASHRCHWRRIPLEVSRPPHRIPSPLRPSVQPVLPRGTCRARFPSHRLPAITHLLPAPLSPHRGLSQCYHSLPPSLASRVLLKRLQRLTPPPPQCCHHPLSQRPKTGRQSREVLLGAPPVCTAALRKLWTPPTRPKTLRKASTVPLSVAEDQTLANLR